MHDLRCPCKDTNRIRYRQIQISGEDEAVAAGKALKNEGYKFDIAYTSVLTRANKTLEAILKEIGQTDLVPIKSWRLNERHYGGLTGLNKAETAAKYGDEQVRTTNDDKIILYKRLIIIIGSNLETQLRCATPTDGGGSSLLLSNS